MRFSIRDLFLVTMIVALVAGWWVDSRQRDALERRAGQAEEDVKWMLNNQPFDFEQGEHGGALAVLSERYGTAPPNSPAPAAIPPKP